METHERETLFSIAADGHQPLRFRKGVVELLQHLDGDDKVDNEHRVHKVEHAVRREIDLRLKGQE